MEGRNRGSHAHAARRVDPQNLIKIQSRYSARLQPPGTRSPVRPRRGGLSELRATATTWRAKSLLLGHNPPGDLRDAAEIASDIGTQRAPFVLAGKSAGKKQKYARLHAQVDSVVAFQESDTPSLGAGAVPTGSEHCTSGALSARNCMRRCSRISCNPCSDPQIRGHSTSLQLFY